MSKSWPDYVVRPLRWSERYTRTDMVDLAHGGGWLFASQIVAMLSGLALSVAFANLVPKDVYGTYQFVLSLAGIIAAFSLTGIAPAIVRAAARGNDNALAHGFALRLLWNIPLVIGALLIALYYFAHGNNTLGTSLLIVGALLPLTTSLSLYGNLLNGKKEYRALSLYQMVGNTIPVFLMLGAIFLTREPVLLILAYYASNAGVLWFLYRRTIRYHVHEGAETEKLNLKREGLHLTAINVLSMAVEQADKVLIFHYLGAIEVAVYTLANAPLKQLFGVNKILKSLVLPKLAENDIASIKKTLPRKALIYLAATIAIVAVYIPLAPFFYGLLFPQYLESIIFSQILALCFLFAPVSILRRTFIAHFQKRELYIAETLNSAALLILLLVLLPLYGIWGAVFARLGGYAFDTIVSVYLFVRLK